MIFQTFQTKISTSSGKYVAEIFVWEGLKNHNALSEYSKLQISVS
jgi:hypothetical protein